MKEVIRRGAFETNSSSTHTLTICSEEIYDKWKDGEYFYDYYDEDLIHRNDCKFLEWERENDGRYLTYDEFWEMANRDFTSYENRKNGAVSFGYYGYC